MFYECLGFHQGEQCRWHCWIFPVAVPGSHCARRCGLAPCRPLPLALLPSSATGGGRIAPPSTCNLSFKKEPSSEGSFLFAGAQKAPLCKGGLSFVRHEQMTGGLSMVAAKQSLRQPLRAATSLYTREACGCATKVRKKGRGILPLPEIMQFP